MSEHVRTVFRQQLTAGAAPLPYYETIGVPLDLNTVPELWTTIEFPITTSARTSLGYPCCYRESGSVIIHVLNKSGKGDSEAMIEAERIRKYFDKPYMADIRILGTAPPALFPTDDGEWLDITVPVPYEWDYRVDAGSNFYGGAK